MTDWTPRAYDPDFTTGRRLEILNALEEGFAVLDARGFIQYVNPAAAQLLGVDPEDVLGWKFVEFPWEIRDPDGTTIPKEDHPSILALRESRERPARVLGATLPTREETLWLEVSARPLLAADGTVDGSVALFRDIGARRAAEVALQASQLRFETLASLLPVGIFQTDADGACIYVNDAWCEIAGMEESEALGDGWMDALHPGDRAWVVQAWEAAAAEGTPFSAEHRYARRDGGVRWVLCQARLLRAEGNAPQGFLGSVTDITEQRAATAIKDQLVGLVSHELRAPLVAIGGALAHLEEHAGELDEDAHRLYDMAVRNTELLQRLVTELLDIDRLRAGVAVLHLDEVSLRTVAAEAAEVVQAVEAKTGVQIDLDALGSGMTVRADRDRLLQVFTNLLSNAVKFSPGGSLVTVAAEETPEAVVVRVTDTGRGIAPEYIETIFERFVQAQPQSSDEPSGAGLGLSIARAIVQRHGGRIWVESTPGTGSTFFFTLPREPAE